MLRVVDIQPFFQRLRAAHAAQATPRRAALAAENTCRVVACRPVPHRPVPFVRPSASALDEAQATAITAQDQSAGAAPMHADSPTAQPSMPSPATKLKKGRAPRRQVATARVHHSQARQNRDDTIDAVISCLKSSTQPKALARKAVSALREPKMAPAVLAFGPTKAKYQAPVRARVTVAPKPADRVPPVPQQASEPFRTHRPAPPAVAPRQATRIPDAANTWAPTRSTTPMTTPDALQLGPAIEATIITDSVNAALPTQRKDAAISVRPEATRWFDGVPSMWRQITKCVSRVTRSMLSAATWMSSMVYGAMQQLAGPFR